MPIAMENPKCMDIITAAMDPTTDEQPLIAQSHGIISLLFSLALDIPVGKGIPIKNPAGIISNAV